MAGQNQSQSQLQPNQLPQLVQTIVQNANNIVTQYESGTWKTAAQASPQQNQQLETMYQFCKSVMQTYTSQFQGQLPNISVQPGIIVSS